MRRQLSGAVVGLATVAVAVTGASALDLPTRKAGLWEIKMNFEGGALPPQVLKQCVDPASDKLLNANFAVSIGQSCSKQEVMRSGGAIIVDTVCTFGETTTTSNAVITGNFDTAYSMRVRSTSQSGPAPGAVTMAVTAKWLSACAADQKPGDVIMANGIKMNVLELRQPGPAAQ
jgi:Protein of unknown function (DUF3617)